MTRKDIAELRDQMQKMRDAGHKTLPIRFSTIEKLIALVEPGLPPAPQAGE